MTSSVRLFSAFRKDKKILVETGTFFGDGIERAFSAGFEKVFTCDINKEYVDSAINKFKDKNLVAKHATSEEALPLFLNEIEEPSVFFLDGHFMPFDSAREDLGFGPTTKLDNYKPCPLIEELNIIKNHHIKTHTILIDDIQDFSTWVFGNVSKNQVLELIASINQNYKHLTFDNVLCFWVD